MAAKKRTDQKKEGAAIEIVAKCPLLRPEFRLLTPCVEIDGAEATKLEWSKPQVIRIGSGRHAIRCYLRNWFGQPVWDTSSTFAVADGATANIEFTLPMTVFGQIANGMKGVIKISISTPQADSVSSAAAAVKPDANLGTCSSCGEEIEPEARFCSECGTKVVAKPGKTKKRSVKGGSNESALV